MRNIILAFRTLRSKGQNNFVKILSLGIGLAMGLVLIAKVYFELTYDDFYPDSNRIYQIQTVGKRVMDDVTRSYGQVSGGVAVGMQAEMPQVELATRFSFIGGDDFVFFKPDKKRYTCSGVILGDSNLFEVLPRPILAGNAKEALSVPMQVMISRKVAEKIGNIQEVVGQSFYFDSYPGRELIIGGIFEDIPANTHVHYDIVVSMPSIAQFMWDGSENWFGNDRYLAYVKFRPNTEVKNTAADVRKVQEKYQDMQQLQEAGVELTYAFEPLTKLHNESSEVRRMALLLSLLAFAVIFTAVMNYILIVISSLVNRTKDVAVNKCYGAGEQNILFRILSETLVHLFLSILLSGMLIFTFRETIEELLATSLSALFTLRSGGLILAVCAIVFLISGIIPARIYSKISVLEVLRTYKESRRKWKLALLFLQFTATAFLFTLLIITGKQYNQTLRDNPGYSYEKLLYSFTSGVNTTDRQHAIDELRRMPEIQSVASSYELPVTAGSGNNVSIPGSSQELFNIVDLYNVDNEYLSLMEIPILEGKGFDKESVKDKQVIVSKSFVDRITTLTGWTDGVIGKLIDVSEHGECTIIGVYPDIRVSSIIDPESRPSAMFYTDVPGRILVMKLHQITPENLKKVSDVLEKALPNKDIVVTPYQLSMIKQYNPLRLFRNSVLTGGIVTLIIALIGLIGYISDEVNRRRSEVAIRKVNGAYMFEVQQLFIYDILRIAIPALLIGNIFSYFTASKWMENFSEKTSMPLWLFILCIFVVSGIILTSVWIATYRVAAQNPSKIINK